MYETLTLQSASISYQFPIWDPILSGLLSGFFLFPVLSTFLAICNILGLRTAFLNSNSHVPWRLQHFGTPIVLEDSNLQLAFF